MAVNRKPRREQGLSELDASFVDRFWTEPFREMIPPGDIDLDVYAEEGFTELSDRIEDLKGDYENNPHFFRAYDDWRHDQNVEAWVDEIERGLHAKEDQLWSLQDEFDLSDLVESRFPKNSKRVKISTEKSRGFELWTESRINRKETADKKAYKAISYFMGSPFIRSVNATDEIDVYLRNANPSIRNSKDLAQRVGVLITNTLIEINRYTEQYAVVPWDDQTREDYVEDVIYMRKRNS